MKPPRDVDRTARWVIAVAVVVGCAWIGLGAWLVYPLPGGDARVFVPTAVRFADGAGLDNPILELVFRTDPRGEGRFCLYPPLFPWLLGALMPAASASAAFALIALFRAAAVIALAPLLVAIARRGRGLDGVVAASIALMCLAYAGMFPPTYGRPESLASLFVLAGLAVEHVGRPGLRTTVALGLLLGLLGATHPAGAVIAVLVLAAGRLARRGAPVRGLLHVGIAAGLGLGVCLVLIAASPSGLADTIEGLRRHSAVQLARSGSIRANLFYWVFWPNFFFFGPLFLWTLTLVCVWRWRRRRAGEQLARRLFAAAVVSLLVAIWFFAWRAPPTAYNLALFQPVVYAVLIALLARTDGASPLGSGRWIRWATIALVAGALAAPLRSTLLGATMLREGTTFASAKRALASAIDDDGFVFYSGSMWVLRDDYERTWAWGEDWVRREPVPGPPRWLVQQETRLVDFRPPRGAPLVLDTRSGRTPRLLGLPIARTPTGYGFALWSLDDAMLAGARPSEPAGGRRGTRGSGRARVR